MNDDTHSNDRSAPLSRQVYRPTEDQFDEMVDSLGRLRPHWRPLSEALDRLGPTSLKHRSERADQLMRDGGATYNIYGDPRGETRAWSLDPVPLLIDAGEWATIESGLVQRAELLDAILFDLYGPRTLLNRGLLPAEAVFAHPSFLRPCSDISPRGGRYLHFYAVDLARGRDGQIRVLGDNTQAPSGFGYALENRIVTAQVLSRPFRDCGVPSLTGFFESLQLALSELVPDDGDSSRIAMLTPGPRNETYFEQAFLASYLGCALVQGRDLLVQDSRLWLDSPSGRRLIDVLVRRLDDDYCDPLEMRSESQLGVPGLTQLARAGALTMANPLGSGIVESPAILPFLPGICRQLLGEELRLPTVATWWCGQPKECDHVLENLDRLIVKPVHRRPGGEPAVPWLLSERDRAELRDRVRSEPAGYVGQEALAFSTAPTSSQGLLSPRAVLLRALLAGSRSGFKAMPGGLTRVAPAEAADNVSSQSGGGSKDTWVLTTKTERRAPVAAVIRQSLATAEFGISPRVAEDLYWVGRYRERAQGAARLYRTALGSIADAEELGSDEGGHCLDRLLPAITQATGTYPGFIARSANGELQADRQELVALASDANRSGGLVPTLRALQSSAFAVRDFWSIDASRQLDAIDDHWLLNPSATPSWQALSTKLEHLIAQLASALAIMTDSMMRDDAWLFMSVGQQLERAQMLGDFVRASLVIAAAPVDERWLVKSVLDATDATAAYHRRHGGEYSTTAVIELLLDADNPRGLRYTTTRLGRALETLSHQGSDLSAGERFLEQLNSQLAAANHDRLAAVTSAPALRGDLDTLLSCTSQTFSQLSTVLADAVFHHTTDLRQLNNPDL